MLILFALLTSWFLSSAHAQRLACRWTDKRGMAGRHEPDVHLSTNYHVPKLRQCKQLCDNTTDCVAVDWRRGQHLCDLYKKVPFIVKEKGSINSVKECVLEGCTVQKRWCVPNATCVNHTCVCPEYAPKGDATIDCVPEDFEVCRVDCDPKVTTWDRAVVPINLPCWYRVTDFYVHTPHLKFLYNKCRVQVHALNELTRDGLFFVRRVLIKLSLGRELSNGKYTWPMFSTAVYDIDSDFVWNAINNKTLTAFDTIPVQQLLDLIIIRKINRLHRVASVIFKQCGVRVKFRPFEPYRQPQTHKPGVSVMTPERSKFPHSASDDYLATVCLKPGQGPQAYERLAFNLSLSSGADVVLHKIFLMGVNAQKPEIEHEYTDQCVAVVKQYTSYECTTHRPLAIRLCTPIVNQRRFVHCLQEANTNLMEVLVSCVKWACHGDVAQCYKFQHHLSHSCPLTRLMRSVGCDPLQRLEISQRIHNRLVYYRNVWHQHYG